MDAAYIGDFPHLTQEELQQIMELVNTSLSNPVSYNDEHPDDSSGLFELFVHKDAPDLFKATPFKVRGMSHFAFNVCSV